MLYLCFSLKLILFFFCKVTVTIHSMCLLIVKAKLLIFQPCTPQNTNNPLSQSWKIAAAHIVIMNGKKVYPPTNFVYVTRKYWMLNLWSVVHWPVSLPAKKRKWRFFLGFFLKKTTLLPAYSTFFDIRQLLNIWLSNQFREIIFIYNTQS